MPQSYVKICNFNCPYIIGYIMAIPYGRQHIDQQDIEAVVETLQADFLTQGPKVKAFEEKFAAYVDSSHALAINNATAGLHLAVKALGCKAGDRVITTPITFAASANCVRYVGAEVWFADIDPNTYVISYEATKALIESKPKGFFKGIVAVAFAGLAVDLEAFRDLADVHGLWIIEDACHAPGASFQNSKAEEIKCGSAQYSDISVFSFHPVKHIACGEGGMLTTRNAELYKRLHLLRSHGISKQDIDPKEKGGWYYDMYDLGFNYRLTDIQSALGISQLSKNASGVQRRNAIAKRYREAFAGKFNMQHIPQGYKHAYHLFVIEVNNRKALYERLREEEIYAQIHYIPIHTLSYYQAIGYGDADLSHSEHYYSRCISLPMYPTLSDAEQEQVIQTVLKYAE